MPDIQLITCDLIDEVRAKAEASARRRMNHNFHPSMEDNPHRLLNVLLRGTYVRPHRHLDPPKAESFIVVQGVRAPVCVRRRRPRPGESTPAPGGPTIGIDIAPGIWHTILADSDCATIFEVKPGPWSPITDKAFAAWGAPRGRPRRARLSGKPSRPAV